MTQNTELVKKSGKSSIFKKLLYSILILLLVIIVIAASLFIYIKTAKTTRDDISLITSAETMSTSERYSFDASSLKMEMNIDKSDLWWLLKVSGYEDKIAELTDNLKTKGLTLKSYGLDITDKGILISAEITYGNFLRLPLKMLTNTAFKDGTLTISPVRLYLGKMALSPEKFPLNQLISGFGIDSEFDLKKYTYNISLPDYDLMSMLTDIYFKDSQMIMVHKLNESLFSSSINDYNEDLSRFAGECTNSIEVLREYSKQGAVGERFTNLVKEFASNPESFPDFITQTLAVAQEPKAKEYLKNNEQWLSRFMPEVTEKSVSDLHVSLYKLYEERSSLFDKLLDKLVTSYNSLQFGIDDKGLTYKIKPFDLKSFMGNEWEKYSSWLDESSFRPVLIDSVSAYHAKTPVLNKITNSIKYLDNVASLNKKYPIGFIAKMQGIAPVINYLDMVSPGSGDKVVIIKHKVALDDSEYEAMMKNPLVPVWKE